MSIPIADLAKRSVVPLINFRGVYIQRTRIIYRTLPFGAILFYIASNIPLAPPDLRAHFSTPHLK